MSQHEIQQDFLQFVSSFQSAVISSLNPQGEAEASYAPILHLEDKFYVYISDLANHTRNLKTHPKAELLFIQDESQCDSIFARIRASIKIHALQIPRSNPSWEEIMQHFEQKQPQMIPLLKTLTDFHLFELTPIEARYVRGFAQAYTLSGEKLNQVWHRKDEGHKK